MSHSKLMPLTLAFRTKFEQKWLLPLLSEILICHFLPQNRPRQPPARRFLSDLTFSAKRQKTVFRDSSFGGKLTFCCNFCFRWRKLKIHFVPQPVVFDLNRWNNYELTRLSGSIGNRYHIFMFLEDFLYRLSKHKAACEAKTCLISMKI